MPSAVLFWFAVRPAFSLPGHPLVWSGRATGTREGAEQLASDYRREGFEVSVIREVR